MGLDLTKTNKIIRTMTETNMPEVVVPEVSAKANTKKAARPAAKKTTAKKAAPIAPAIEELLSPTLKPRSGASTKKLISALEAQGITNKPAIKRSLKTLLEKGVLVAATGTGLNGSIKINPEESARRKKAAAAKAAKAKKSRRCQEEEGCP